ncbi:MAG: hypothetical protein ISS91_04970, partial [Candidatus Omnitrophica bacterium]|nr:hypothetical protein [Candidatus Omnitrophota bacterium]
MFKNFMALWKGKDFLTEVLEDFKKMLNDSKCMFNSVIAGLIEGKTPPDLKSKIYEMDRRVNRVEREIRKRIVEHLAIQPSVDVPVSLVFMSVVKDAERVGDYCKNIFELIALLGKPLDNKIYQSFFNGIEGQITDLFAKTEKAFIKSDEELAREILSKERKIMKNCDEIVGKLAKSSLSTNEGVCLALLARYFKRVAAHLTNIGSSVILPVSDLDFFDEKLRQDREE